MRHNHMPRPASESRGRVGRSTWQPGLILIVLALAMSAVIFIGHSSQSPAPATGAVGAATPIPESVGLQSVGIRYGKPISASVLSNEQAIQAAEQWLGAALTSEATQITTQYVLFSDDQNYSTDAQGIKHFEFQQVPAWVVTFEGLSLPNHPPPGKPIHFNHEENVVINATTGVYMEAFSYQ